MYDLHMHSKYSFDGHHEVAELCERAIELGMNGIAITDHIDQVATPRLFPEFTPDKLALTAKGSFESAIEAQIKYSGRLEVFRGIELGQALHNRELSEFILHTYDYDFVHGSIHNLRATDDFYFIKYESAEHAHTLLHEYFNELLNIINWGMFDSLAHLTYPLRYMVGRDKISVDISLFKEKIDEILSLIIKKDIALEINTSGLRQEIEDTLPSEHFVRRYRELGGKYITFGSDTHRIGDFAFGLCQGTEMAQRCGFDSLTIFRKRKPYLVPFNECAGGLWQSL